MPFKLEKPAAYPAFDGHVQAGQLAGRSVNVKWYLRQESVLDMTVSPTLDYYLVMTGPWLSSALGRNTSLWVIDYVYLFDAQQLLAEKQRHGVKIGLATSVQGGVEGGRDIPHTSLPVAAELREMTNATKELNEIIRSASLEPA